MSLDIDTASVEIPLAEELLGDSTLLKLVDEFFFEYHFKDKDIDWLWGNDGFTASIQETYKLFSNLRKKGVRAHPWP